MLSMSPSNMPWIQLCLLLCVTSIQVSCTVTNFTCEPTQFSCLSGRCISIAWACDGEDDCNDNSDEIGCSITTCSDMFFRCDNGKCIPERWLCDDSAECSDSSDENPLFCSNRTCDGHRCAKSNICVPERWKCDGNIDCPNDDDEKDCQIVCNPVTEFKCSDTHCISGKWRCDGNSDCTDGSDEADCPKVKCDAVGEKLCNDNTCINEQFWCDGEYDCDDKSDEMNCTHNTTDLRQKCGINEFQCDMPFGKCIHIEWKCDSDPDCPDGSDEKDCGPHSCSSNEKLCGTSTCLKLDFFCDGEDDCDGEDEKDCNKTVEPPSHCGVHEFDCGNKCISNKLVCNRADDCGNGLDESPDRHCPPEANNSCLINNGGCQHLCYPDASEKYGRKCDCNLGFEMADNSETDCEDMDECGFSGTCSQICTNTKGSYKCECVAGYTLVNHRLCKASQGNPAELLLSDRRSIRRIHLDTFNYSPLLQQFVEDGAAVMDFDVRKETVFWANTKSQNVFSASLKTNVSMVIVENAGTPEGLAVDWIHGNLYILDSSLGRIDVAHLNGSNRKSIVSHGMDKPRALVVDPSSGWMYWVDYGEKPKIEKCAMNGQYRKEIVTRGIFWPKGLTIDYVQQRLYWIDARHHTISSSDLDGNNFKLVLKSHKYLGHPISVTVFEDYLYWTDWMTSAVHKFSKFGRESNITTIAMDLKSPMDVHVYQLMRQPASENRCGSNNGGCSHLCLPVPKVNTSSKTSECACPNGMVLSGQFNCIQSNGATTEVEVHDDSSFKNSQTTSDLTTQEVTTDKSEGEPSSTQSATEAESINKTHTELGQRDSEGAGYIAGIVIAVILITGVAISVLVYLLLKRHRSKNIKSMNFDNPVYRKTTTEDHLIMEKSGSRSSLPQSMQPLNQDNEIV